MLTIPNNIENIIVEFASKVTALLGNHFTIHLSPIIKNIDKFNYWLDTIPFYMNVQKDGVLLNG